MVPLLLQAAAGEPVSGSAGVVVAGGIIAIVKLVDFMRDRRRETARDEKLEAAVDKIGAKVDASQLATDRRCDTIERQVNTLSAHIIGPDGENGIRGDLREVKKRVIGLEERERDRLQRGVGHFDRRTGS